MYGFLFEIISPIVAIRNNIKKTRQEAIQAKKRYEKMYETIQQIENLPLFESTVENNYDSPVMQAEAIIKARKALNLCKEAGICPICGRSLSKESWDNDDENLLEFYKILYCKKCKRRFEKDVKVW